MNVLNATELYTLEWSLVRYVNVTSVNPAAAPAPSIIASQPRPGALPLPGPYPFGPLREGLVMVLFMTSAATFSVVICLKVFHSPLTL